MNSTILSCLSNEYGIDAKGLIYLPIGAGQHVTLYKADTLNGVSYFVKMMRGHTFDVSVQLMELFQKIGTRNIIFPIKTMHDKSFHDFGDMSLIVYPFIKGVNGFEQELTKTQWIELGETLRKIHDIRIPVQLKHRVRHETFSSKWRKFVHELLKQLETDVIPAVDKVASNMLDFMKEHIHEIRQLLAFSDTLAERINNINNNERHLEFVLCHSDIHAGNILIDSNSSIHIVDWDHPILAPRERDLMFIGGGVGNVWNDPAEERYFYEGYGEIAIDKLMLSYYRVERVIEDIAVFGKALLVTETEIVQEALKQDTMEKRIIMYEQFINIFKAEGVVDIALNTIKSLKL